MAREPRRRATRRDATGDGLRGFYGRTRTDKDTRAVKEEESQSSGKDEGEDKEWTRARAEKQRRAKGKKRRRDAGVDQRRGRGGQERWSRTGGCGKGRQNTRTGLNLGRKANRGRCQRTKDEDETRGGMAR